VKKEKLVWLVWSVGSYANGVPCVDLRAVCTSRASAIEKTKMILDWAKGRNDLLVRRTEIEERRIDHCYGLEMQLINKGVVTWISKKKK
jgi:hypothetical protein